MKHRQAGLLVLAGVLIVCCTASAAPRYALAASSNEIYVFRSEGKWGTNSWAPLYWTPPGSASFAGVATDGQYVYVVDSLSSELIVGRIGNIFGTPTWTHVKTVTLKNDLDTLYVAYPSQIAASPSGGAYVIGQPWLDSNDIEHSTYAYVKPNGGWDNPIVSIGELAGSTLMDVAVNKSGSRAIIAHVNDNPETGSSHAAIVVEDTLVSSSSLLPKSYNAQAVAVHNAAGDQGYAYVVNYNSDGLLNKGSVRVVDASTGAPASSDTLEFPENMIPHDVTTFTVSGNHYLGIIGSNGGNDQAWKVELNEGADWAPLLDGRASAGVARSNTHQAAASDDGEVFWYTSGNAVMGAWSTASWSPIAGFDGDIGGTVELRYLTGLPISAVPEPSTLISLAALVGAGVWRRRRNI